MSEIPFETISNLISQISQFLSVISLPGCECAFGEVREFLVGTVEGDRNDWQGKCFIANRQYHLGWVLSTEVTSQTVREGRRLPFIDGSDFYYRFTSVDVHRSFYATGIFSENHGWALGPETPIYQTKTWVPALCAQPAIGIFPALGHRIAVHAVYLYPSPDCVGGGALPGGEEGEGGDGDPGTGGWI